MLRIIWVYLNALLYVLIHIIPIRRRYRHPERYSINDRYKRCKRLCDLIARRTGCSFTVIGTENIPKDQPVLYVANHASMLDPYLVGATSPYQMGAVIAGDDGYENIPIIAPLLKSVGSVFVDRENPREAIVAIKEAVENVKKGHSMLLFPEGEITHYLAPGEVIAPFQTGGLKIATKGKIPIIPVAISGTAKAYPKRAVIGPLRKGKITMRYLEPYTKHLEEDIRINEVAQELRELMLPHVNQE